MFSQDPVICANPAIWESEPGRLRKRYVIGARLRGHGSPRPSPRLQARPPLPLEILEFHAAGFLSYGRWDVETRLRSQGFEQKKEKVNPIDQQEQQSFPSGFKPGLLLSPLPAFLLGAWSRKRSCDLVRY